MIGIYKITNKINGKIYIGQSWDIEKRWKEEKNGGCNSHLLFAFNKYGIETFSFEVLKEFEKTNYPEILLQKHLDRLEIMFIKYFDSMNRENGYNKKSGGGNGKPCEETKCKISNTLKGKYSGEKCYLFGRTGNKHPMFGKHFSKEHKIKLSKSVSKSIICIETGKVYKSGKQASEELKISRGNISSVCRGNRKTTGGYHFEYYNEKNI